MRFLLLNQFYPPDVAPTGKYLHDLARSLVQRGHQVKVICSRCSYEGSQRYPAREVRDGVEIVRLPATAFGRHSFVGKLSDYVTFYGALMVALMTDRSRPNLILSLTTPPFLGLLGKLGAKRHRCRHAHWIMDLYPDVMFAHGMTRKRGLIFRLLSWLTHFQLHGASSILALGPTMAKQVSVYAQGESGKTAVDWVPLWSDPDLKPWLEHQPNSLRTQRGWSSGDTVFLYSGNMGLGHRFSEFLQAAKQLEKSGPRWAFSGGGKRRAEIEQAAREMPQARIEFLDYIPASKLVEHLCAADVHLASLDSAWQGLMVPSKLQGSFAVGRPVLFVGGRNCETASWILESGGGWVVDENDGPGLLDAITAARDPENRRRRGQCALRFARCHFQMSVNCVRIAELLEGRKLTGQNASVAAYAAVCDALGAN